MSGGEIVQQFFGFLLKSTQGSLIHSVNAGFDKLLQFTGQRLSVAWLFRYCRHVWPLLSWKISHANIPHLSSV